MKYCPDCATPLEPRQVGERQRAACPASGCDFVHWDNPTPVVAAIVELDGQVVLARNALWPPGMLSIITGFLESGESVEECVLREVQEELGLEGEIVEFVGYYPFFRQNQLILAFHVLGRGEIKLGEELAEYKLIPATKLKPWPFGTGEAVRDWLQRRQVNLMPNSVS